ncbi:MAG TPA: D-2-hydroxyacid dehydrogenase [Solirubrobacteraceae bacterium]|nr:D-2-hydroxyacid dehydrogenase [Solirubrobacteraceae bacterium]
MSVCEVVIASYLEPELVERVARAEPRAHVTYEPALLPTPRFPCDHGGEPPRLSAAELRRWQAIVASADVCFDFDWHDPATLPRRCPRLRFVQATSAGIGEFMTCTGLDRAQFAVSTAAGIHAVPLAEFAVMGALYFVKELPRLGTWKAERHWERYATNRLAGRRALVIGLGGVGRETVRQLAALGMEVWGLARRAPAEPVQGLSRAIDRHELDDALARTDVLVIACPLTDETQGMIGSEQIAALPPGAIVVNVGRGPVIDEVALIESLGAGRLGGACLDVFESEPLAADSPLWEMENVIVSPHSASTLVDENATLTELFIDNLGRHLDGRPLRNPYDAAAGY